MSKYYNLNKIKEFKATYNVIIGQRSNGKTYATIQEGLEHSWNNNRQFAIVRRWADDFKGKRARTMFDGHVNNGEIERITKGVWNDVMYVSGAWYWARYDEELKRMVTSIEPFAYAFAISQMEHDKSTSYPLIDIIIFDEFIARAKQGYLPDEFVLFMNVVSTIVRKRTNVVIYMLGNTINQFCPYFAEMGLIHIKKQHSNTIDIYTYGESALKVAVERCGEIADKDNKETNKYFAFNNPKLQMITGGAWELEIYPHCPCKYTPKDIAFTYYIKFDGEMLQAEIISCKDEEMGDLFFTYIHRKTTPIKNPKTDLVYTPDYNPQPNFRRKLNKPTNDTEKKIVWFFANDKVFYQDNEVGEIVTNYIMWCNKNR